MSTSATQANGSAEQITAKMLNVTITVRQLTRVRNRNLILAVSGFISFETLARISYRNRQAHAFKSTARGQDIWNHPIVGIDIALKIRVYDELVLQLIIRQF